MNYTLVSIVIAGFTVSVLITVTLVAYGLWTVANRGRYA